MSKKKQPTDPAAAKKKRRKKIYRRLIVLFWLGILTPFVVIATMLSLAASGAFGELPSFEELENPKSNLATEIVSADHKLLGKYFKENRTNAKYDELSPYLLKALVATEDERFYEHSGVDGKGVVRAVVYLGKRGGASTITQQLAKMLFHKTNRLSFFERVQQKFKEWIIAAQLERRYTKEEILTMYLNRFDFLNNAVGVKSAASVYFNRDTKDLKIEEAALLVGLAKNPSLYNPLRFYERAKNRRNTVLFQMLRNEDISQAQHDSLCLTEIVLDYRKVDHNEGPAPYFREALREDLQEMFSQKNEDGTYVYSKDGGKSPYNVYKDGLKVYTTIDSRMQEYAEYAVTQHLSTDLQPLFNKKLADKRNRPFTYKLSTAEIAGILSSAKKRSNRYHVLVGKECSNCGRRGERNLSVDSDSIRCKNDDCLHVIPTRTDAEIDEIFNTPVKMKVFDWTAGKENRYEKDTILSPIDSIRHYKGFFQVGMMSMDPHTGFVKAWVGGIDHHHFKYDHVRKAHRQVGSTFKPFIYASYIQDNHSPCEQMPNTPIRFDKDIWGMDADWQPNNSDGKYGGMVSLKFGLANSLNTISARIMHSFGPGAGPERVVTMARSMGVTSNLAPVPSLALGVADLSVWEMVGANSTFANKGVYIKPIILTRIEDKHGNVVYDVIPETTEAMDEETAYLILVLMKGVCDGVYNPETGKRSSTGGRIRFSKTEKRPYGGIKFPVAGKTGTTQNNSDGWFMGITPDLVTGVWTGAEDRSVHFESTAYGQGANMALPIWGYYMNKVYADKSIKISTGDFEKPAYLETELDCNVFDDVNAPLVEPDFGDDEGDDIY
jgi:penicillin-binding protein 1A